MQAAQIDVTKHFALVHIMIKRHFRHLLDLNEYDELFQIGCLGLIEARDRFDSSRGLKFSTYATRLIWGSIKRHQRNYRWIKIPRVDGEFRKHLTGDERPEDVSKQYGVPISTAINAIAHVSLKRTSLDKPMELDDGFVTLYEQIPISEDFSQQEVTEFLSGLLPRWRSAVLLMMEGYDQQEIARRLGVSQAQVSRIRSKTAVKYLEFIGGGEHFERNRTSLDATHA